jgi:hypothetical protein
MAKPTFVPTEEPRRTVISRAANGVYLERLSDGCLWNGLSTYAHASQGEELEILLDVMLEERKNLFRRG